ncbi:MAG: hypothetical protein H6Q74_2758 [Firmicutes bacterium]|nr:hypothetical protein [Bacillota bacterium]
MSSTKNKAIFIQALIGAILVTVLLIPFQALTSYAPYTWMIFIPLILFFSFGGSQKLLPAMFLSFLSGILWGIAFFYLAAIMNGLPMPMVFGILTTALIFGILAIHLILLGKTPFGMVPCVLIGFVESLFIFLIKPSNVSSIGSIQLIAFFAYGIVLSYILVNVSGFFCKLALGKDWLNSFNE